VDVNNVIVFADLGINYTGRLFENLLQIIWPVQWTSVKLLTPVLSAYVQTYSAISKTISQQIRKKPNHIVWDFHSSGYEEFCILRCNAIHSYLLPASCWYLDWLTLQQWRRQYAPLKWWLTFNRLHVITYHKQSCSKPTHTTANVIYDLCSLCTHPLHLHKMLAFTQWGSFSKRELTWNLKPWSPVQDT
jgi:hypothetical protein